MKFPNEEDWTEEHRAAMEEAILRGRQAFHETTVVSYANRNRKLAEAFRAAKAQLDITDEMRVKHGNVYVQQPPPRSEYPLWEVLLQWALDMAYEIGTQVSYAWRQHKHWREDRR